MTVDSLTQRDRFLKALRYESVDRHPVYLDLLIQTASS